MGANILVGPAEGDGFKLKESIFRVGIRKKVLMMKLLNHWTRGGRCPIPGNIQG